jgi:hypothetical protein
LSTAIELVETVDRESSAVAVIFSRVGMLLRRLRIGFLGAMNAFLLAIDHAIDSRVPRNPGDHSYRGGAGR